jgi:hypothetical protein
VRHARAALIIALLAAPSPASPQEPQDPQDPAAVYQTEKRISFKVDGLVRREWTKEFVVSEGVLQDSDRWRGQLRPRLELNLGKLVLGVGGDFNYSSDENTEGSPAIVRDNYKSRDARVDLAFGRLEAGWLRLEGGRFVMPVPLTEMIWDRDLRPQGGALTLDFDTHGGRGGLAFTVLGARGSHVFDDDDTEMLVLSGGARLPTGREQRLELLGAYVAFYDVDALEPIIRRQNLRVAGVPPPAPLALDYRVVDLVLRLRSTGSVPALILAEYCWNTEADELNKGLWAAVAVGSTETGRTRVEYTYAKVDRDATLAAYATDDFLWGTGWEGHRVDVGFRSGGHASVHAIGQLQRFKDSPRDFERDDWVKRYRIEVRVRN